MIRVKDRVRVASGAVAVVESAEGGRLRVRFDYDDVSRWRSHVDDGDVTLLCAASEGWCIEPAEYFTPDGLPLCQRHARSSGGPYLPVRPSVPPALVACACGESLDGARSSGVWTMGEIACEYRQCSHCGSHRAYAPRDTIHGRLVALYESPDTSEVSREWPSFLDAIEAFVESPRAELRRNGVVLARAFRSVDGRPGWAIATPELESD